MNHETGKSIDDFMKDILSKKINTNIRKLNI